MSMQRGIVKSVLSGDTIIVRPEQAPPKGQPAKERVIHLSGISAPRLGSLSREDEPFSFAAREYLRPMLVGKLVQYNITHAVEGSKTGSNTDREYGTVFAAPASPGGPPQDIAMLAVANGWAKVRDQGGEGEEAVRRLGAEEAKRRESLRQLESEAQAEGKGLWASTGEEQRTVSFQMPADSQAFLTEYKGKDLDAIVEQVRDGSNIRVRLLLEDGSHQFINLSMAGIKSPKASSGRDGDFGGSSEEWGEEAKFFTESRLLQRLIKVQLLSAPISLGAPPSAAGKTATGALPAPQSVTSTVMIGTAIHPNGNIAEFLLAQGLAKVIDWHAGILSTVGGMDRLRAAEKSGKDKKAGVWENFSAPTRNGTSYADANGSATAASSTTKGSTFDATVVRIWNADSVSVIEKGRSDRTERRLTLASIRSPKGADDRAVYYANEAKEFLRKKLIGKNVHVFVDYVKPREGNFEEKECVTIRYGGASSNVSEQLVEKGLATVLRHKKGDEDRSAELDKLIIAEQNSVTQGLGMHSTKEVVLPRVVDASENGSKAAQFLPTWKRAGKHQALVNFVASGSRFKLFLPKENKKITFVLAGVKAPRAARSAQEKSEPFGNEAYQWSNARLMQRDVQITFDSTDKQGGFIGSMHIGNQNVAVELAREGLATTHEYSAANLPFVKDLFEAEEQAKKAKRNIWSVQEKKAETEVKADQNDGALPPQYLDVVVSSVKETSPFGFSVQMVNADNASALEKLMKELAAHYKTASSTAGWTPKSGELVSAQFSKDAQWYRAKVKRSSNVQKKAELRFIDYGFEESVPYAKIRPLDAKFKSLPGQAQEARLSFVQPISIDKDYGQEALDMFNHFTEGRKLIANIDQREGQTLHLRLIDPSDPHVASDPLACINADLVREGLATLDKSLKYPPAYPQMVEKMKQASKGAIQDRLGIFEFGDVSED